MHNDNEILNPSFERKFRLDFDGSMMIAAVAISHMSSCRRRNVGCILSLDRHIVATGFNGAPSGLIECLEDEGCLLHDGHCINCIHAEANAFGRCLKADTAYCTDQPCVTCLKLLIQKGVTTIFYLREYDDEATRKFMNHHYKENLWITPLLLEKVEDNELLLKIDNQIKEFVQRDI